MSIIVSEKGMNAKKIEPTSISAEHYLQAYIENNPQSIPVSDIKEDLRLLILAREFPTTSGKIDALGIDQDGNIYVVETKLAKNPDKRLVIAQVLDYGAALWKESENLDEFMEKLERAVAKTPGSTLGAVLEGFIGDGEDVESLRTAIRENLAAGELRFVVLMDHLEDRLRNLITFVNRNSQFTIYGVEMEFYKFDKYEILIPRLYGAEVTKELKKPMGDFPVWTWDEFINAVENKDSRNVESICKLYKLSQENADKVTSRPKARAGKAGGMDVTLNSMGPRALYSVSSTGRLDLNFNWLTDNENSESLARRFCEALKHLPGFEMSSDSLFRGKCQRIDFEQWSQSLNDFIAAVRAIRQEASQTDAL